MNTPIVSVVIPVYNVGERLAPTVRSVLGQTFRDFELILVDDGSSDGAVDNVLEEFRGELRLRVIRQPNKGVSSVRNAGMDAMRGRYLFFMDADDFIHAELLARTVPLLERSPESDFVLFDFVEALPGHEPSLTASLEEICPETMSCPSLDFFRDDLRWQAPSVWRFLYRVSALRGLRFNPTFWTIEDSDFTYRLLHQSKCGLWLPQPLYVYMTIAGSLSRKYLARPNFEEFERDLRNLASIASDSPELAYLMRRKLFPEIVKTFVKPYRRQRLSADVKREFRRVFARLLATRVLTFVGFKLSWKLRFFPLWVAGCLGYGKEEVSADE